MLQAAAPLSGPPCGPQGAAARLGPPQARQELPCAPCCRGRPRNGGGKQVTGRWASAGTELAQDPDGWNCASCRLPARGRPCTGAAGALPRGLPLTPPHREIRNVELLKLRFGEAPMHFCEVMLKVGPAAPPRTPRTPRPGRRLSPASPPGYGGLPPHQRQHPRGGREAARGRAAAVWGLRRHPVQRVLAPLQGREAGGPRGHQGGPGGLLQEVREAEGTATSLLGPSPAEPEQPGGSHLRAPPGGLWGLHTGAGGPPARRFPSTCACPCATWAVLAAPALWAFSSAVHPLASQNQGLGRGICPRESGCVSSGHVPRSCLWEVCRLLWRRLTSVTLPCLAWLTLLEAVFLNSGFWRPGLFCVLSGPWGCGAGRGGEGRRG